MLTLLQFEIAPLTRLLIAAWITAWNCAQNLKAAEEFRLLYIAMTRTKRLLWLSAVAKAPYTWSKPRQHR